MLNLVPFVSVDHMMKLVHKIGIERVLTDLALEIEAEFARALREVHKRLRALQSIGGNFLRHNVEQHAIFRGRQGGCLTCFMYASNGLLNLSCLISRPLRAMSSSASRRR